MELAGEHRLSDHVRILPGYLDQAAACAAVRPNGHDEFMSVTPEHVPSGSAGVEQWRYRDAASSVWANLIVVDADIETPVRQIDPTAGTTEGAYYYECCYPLSGSGAIDIWHGDERWVSNHYTCTVEAPSENPVVMLRGDSYRLQAGPKGLSLLRLAVETPLPDEYELPAPSPSTP